MARLAPVDYVVMAVYFALGAFFNRAIEVRIREFTVSPSTC